MNHANYLITSERPFTSITMSESNNIISRRLSDELLDFCASASVSEEGLREIIQRHELTPNHDNHNVDDYGFFRFMCQNERVTERIVQFLLENFPDAANAASGDGSVPLHAACYNKNAMLNIVQILIDAAPESVHSENNYGHMPLHILCANDNVSEIAAVKILKLLIKKYPEALRHIDNDDRLPIQLAASWGTSPEVCSVLIEAYPGSERMTSSEGELPLHDACFNNTVAMVEYLYRQYPGGIAHTTTRGLYPIHAAIKGLSDRDNPGTAGEAAEIVQFLLDCDPSVKLQKHRGRSLLSFACGQEYDDSNIHAALAVIKVIYDFYPEAIEGNKIIPKIQNYHHEVQLFILIQLGHARQAKVDRLHLI